MQVLGRLATAIMKPAEVRIIVEHDHKLATSKFDTVDYSNVYHVFIVIPH